MTEEVAPASVINRLLGTGQSNRQYHEQHTQGQPVRGEAVRALVKSLCPLTRRIGDDLLARMMAMTVR